MIAGHIAEMDASRESRFSRGSRASDSPDGRYQLPSPDPLLGERREPLLYFPSQMSSASVSSPFSYDSSGSPTRGPLRFPSQQSVPRAVLSGLSKTFGKEVFWWLLTPFLLLVLWLIWSASTSMYSSSSRGLDYGLVIDAGSHGSRLTVFSWESRVYDPGHPLTGPVTIPLPLCQGTPGPPLSSFTEKRELPMARQALKAMLDEAQVCLSRHRVPADAWGEFPLFLKATGGMRNLSQGVRDFLMEFLRDSLQDPRINPFQFHRSWARVISGEEEGVYGWLAANSVRGSLSDEPEKTVGALDMGGASMQITFSPEHTSVLEDFNAVHLGDRLIRLYSHSFLGYGWSDAFNRISTALGVEALLSQIRDDPAFVKKNARIPEAQTSFLSGPATAPGGERAHVDLPAGGGHRLKSRRLQGKKQDREQLTRERQVALAALHPCLPRGSKLSFQMPSLAYPERRFYVDLDVRKVAAYMRAAEYSRKDVLNTVQSMAPYGAEMRHTLQDMQESHVLVPGASRSIESPAAGRPNDKPGVSAEAPSPPPHGSRGVEAPLLSVEKYKLEKAQKAVDADEGSQELSEVESPRSFLSSPERLAPVVSYDHSDRRRSDNNGSLPGTASGAAAREEQGNRESGALSAGVLQDGTQSPGGPAGEPGEGRETGAREDENVLDERMETKAKQGGVEVTLELRPRNKFLLQFLGSGDFGACRDRAFKYAPPSVLMHWCGASEATPGFFRKKERREPGRGVTWKGDRQVDS